MEEDPASTREALVQVKVPPVAVAPGAFMFWITVVVEIDEQLFMGFIVVRTYEPTALTTGFCKVEVKLFGPAQL